MIYKEDVDKSMSFQAYYQLVEELAGKGGTTGLDQNESLIEYTKLNYSRMKRILKTTPIAPEVIDTVHCFTEKLTWLVLAESWCGDAAQNIPVLEKIAEANPNIEVRIILRDENPDIMDRFLTKGSRSIPKLIAIDENYQVLGTWGPRPSYLQDWLYREKNDPTMEMSTLKVEFQKWYAQDKGQTLQREMILLMKEWLEKECFGH
ncbi:MAG: thioredoxin family protein [Flavobacteriales bacterium]|nr:thioredoxin family protein [Flavobacteriales bacterium]